jgi:hypothetical protein
MNLPLAPILGQFNPVHNLPYYFFRINFNIILPSTPMSLEWSVRSGFRAKTWYDFLFSHTRVTFPVHLINFDLIVVIIFGEKYT